MISTLRLLFSGFILCLAFTSCSKEYSTENGGSPTNTPAGTTSGTAVFTIAGAPGACTTPLISGIYQQGTPLDATNTAVITVDVTTIGTYVVSTATINGISFSGSGTFVITGLQVIVLTGTGTPTSGGTFTFIPGTDGCSFPLVITGTSSGGVALGTLSCSSATIAGTYTQGVLLTSANTITIPFDVTVAGSYSINTAVINGVTFSGSGNLALGNQSVVLTGNGLPVNSGAVAFPISLGTAGSCDISITFNAGTPSAEGILDCASAVSAGTYTQGIPLDASNTITIQANVTVAGPYSIVSSQFNGVSFSGSGTLTLGTHTIVLTGNGIPNSSGTFAMPIGLGTSSCSVDINFGAGSTDYLRVKIDGVLKNFSVNLDGDITPLLLPNSVAVEGDVTSGPDPEHIDVTVQSATTITAGTYFQPFGLSFCTSRYYDPISGQGWQASTPSSPALKVIITSITSSRVIGTFSGQYFDFNGTGTNTKQLTEGAFSVPLP